MGNGVPYTGYESLLLVLSHYDSATRCAQTAICAEGNVIKIKARVLDSAGNWGDWKSIIS